MNNCVIVRKQIVQDTLGELQTAGRRRSECVILWLGQRDFQGITVARMWKPEQEADRGYFLIPEKSVDRLMAELRKERLMIAAQVHTHPKLAFHSAADDKWAIVRHVGALSLVVPHYALRTNAVNFVQRTAAFCLNAENEWLQAPQENIQDFYKIVP